MPASNQDIWIRKQSLRQQTRNFQPGATALIALDVDRWNANAKQQLAGTPFPLYSRHLFCKFRFEGQRRACRRHQSPRDWHK